MIIKKSKCEIVRVVSSKEVTNAIEEQKKIAEQTEKLKSADKDKSVEN